MDQPTLANQNALAGQRPDANVPAASFQQYQLAGGEFAKKKEGSTFVEKTRDEVEAHLGQVTREYIDLMKQQKVLEQSVRSLDAVRNALKRYRGAPAPGVDRPEISGPETPAQGFLRKAEAEAEAEAQRLASKSAAVNQAIARDQADFQTLRDLHVIFSGGADASNAQLRALLGQANRQPSNRPLFKQSRPQTAESDGSEDKAILERLLESGAKASGQPGQQPRRQ
jgi:hypothetical protein